MTTAIALIPGKAAGKPVLLQTPLSFWGGYDSTTGNIIDQHHPDHGLNLAGCILMMEAGRGSSSGSSVLAEAIRAGTAPAAILMRQRDAIVVTGAIVAAELYNILCPIIVIASEAEWLKLATANQLSVQCNETAVTFEFSKH
ncbi:MAG: aconitase X swivel domain-containing protein [Beijerinckiaceae bacterium]